MGNSATNWTGNAMTLKKINLTKDFHLRPFGRYLSDSNRSAEAFRDNLLIPAIQSNHQVILDLSGTNYYGSSFLEETFGGLVRQGITMACLKRKLKIIHSKLPSIVSEAWEYVEEAEEARAKHSAVAD